MLFLASGFNPFQKYVLVNEIISHWIGVKMTNIWNHPSSEFMFNGLSFFRYIDIWLSMYIPQPRPEVRTIDSTNYFPFLQPTGLLTTYLENTALGNMQATTPNWSLRIVSFFLSSFHEFSSLRSFKDFPKETAFWDIMLMVQKSGEKTSWGRLVLYQGLRHHLNWWISSNINRQVPSTLDLKT